GSKPALFAYVTKNEYVFHSVDRNRLDVSATRSVENRRELPGGDAVYMYQRIASAPCALSTVHGSTTFPRDFDIFWPSPSRIRPRHTTFWYASATGTSSGAAWCRSVASACSV